MSFFGDLEFFIYLIIALIPAIILDIKEKKIKYYTIVITIFFLWLILGNDYKQIAYLIVYAFLELHIVKIYLLLKNKFGKSKTIYFHALVFSILPLLLCKLSTGMQINIFGFIGISYLTFRTVQIIIETYDGLIENINVIDFLTFLFFFPTLSSGPIDRSRRFFEDINKVYSKKEYIELLGNGIQKICIGILYKFVLSGILNSMLLNVTGSYSPKYVIAYAYLYGFYMFFDFAGYSLMAIGTSYILGIKVPDNFNKPFISIDIKDFWNRWHITLSHWFRDFVFTRFMMNSIRNKRFNTRLTAAFMGFMVNMLVMGVWHGFSWYYILYGLYHGVLLGITEIYQKKSKFYKKYKDKKMYKLLSWFITINLVMFGFLVFSGYIGNVADKYMKFLLN